MYILIELEEEAHEAIKMLAIMEKTTEAKLKAKIFCKGLEQLSKENKQLANLLKSKDGN